MITVNLRDGCFPGQHSATLAGDAANERPRLMQWRRIAPGAGAGETVVFTDFCLTEAPTSPAARKIAWLIEPPSINPVSYQTLRELRGSFDAVFTHQRDVARELGGLWCPFGGSRIPAAERVIAAKDRNVCIIASEKCSAPGHRLRHEVIARFGAHLDVYGPDYGGRVAHRDILPRYRAAVIIENEQSDNWFTEKLIDPLLVGTIPIYWGADFAVDFPSVHFWEDWTDLGICIRAVDAEVYADMADQIRTSAVLAQQYICAEDWIARSYPDILR